MMRSEFEELTGLFPTDGLYAAIERKYIDMDIDKTLFCERYKNNTDGLAAKIQRAANMDSAQERYDFEQALDEQQQTIDALRKQIEKLGSQVERLTEALEREQEWKPCDMPDNISQADYERLASTGREMSEDEAKQLIWEEFGFDKDKIVIRYSIPGHEINRHGKIRRTDEEIERRPFYDATDWNYVRFNCAGWWWEMHNGELHPFMM